MRITPKLFILTLTLSAATLFAQAQQQAQSPPAAEGAQGTPQDTPVTQQDSSATAAPAEPAPTQELSAQPTTALEPQPPFVDEGAPPAPPENGARTEASKPAERKIEQAEGKILSLAATNLTIQTGMGEPLSFVLDANTEQPKDLKVDDAVAVEFVTLDDGTHRASRVSRPKPRPAAAVAAKPAKPRTPPPAANLAEPASSALLPSHEQGDTSALQGSDSAAPEVARGAASDATASVANGLVNAPSTPSASPEANPSETGLASPSGTATASAVPWPVRLVLPLVLLVGGICILTAMGIRQARHEF